jgi:hypothetical protein
MAFPPRTRLTTGLLASLLLGTAACSSDPLRPVDVAGIYALQQVGSDPLPTVLYESEYARVHVLADTLRLNADGTGIRTSVLTTEPLREGIAGSDGERVERQLYFELAFGRVLVTFVCPPNANCAPVPPYVARRISNGLLLDAGRAPLTYTRVSDTHH